MMHITGLSEAHHFQLAVEDPCRGETLLWSSCLLESLLLVPLKLVPLLLIPCLLVPLHLVPLILVLRQPVPLVWALHPLILLLGPSVSVPLLQSLLLGPLLLVLAPLLQILLLGPLLPM